MHLYGNGSARLEMNASALGVLWDTLPIAGYAGEPVSIAHPATAAHKGEAR